MQLGRTWVAFAVVVVAALCGSPLQAAAQAAMTRAQALAALEQPLPLKRAEGIARLAEIGTMPDTERLARRLADDDEQVRSLANLAMWRIWGRSDDPAIDALFKRGVEQMEAADFDEALATFTDIIRRKPAFAEGWNKRATILFLLGQHEASLHDCREVLKRNALHYGALSGMGQIYLQLGDLDQALLHFQRALKVNPHLPGAAEAVRLIEQHQPGRRLTT
jgi:tetratricopeptide (TPR) repeat protein